MGSIMLSEDARPPLAHEEGPGRAARSNPAARRIRVLACAFACAPPGSPTLHGGEELLGWRLVKEASRFHEVTVLASGEHRGGLEGELRRHPDPNLTFVFVDLPRWMVPLRGFQGGIQFYSYVWQVKAYFVARTLHRRRPFDLFHHMTYSNDWMASFIGALLPVPYVRGPGGGAQVVPRRFRRDRGLRFWWAQLQRSLLQRVFRLDPFFRIGQRRARALLLSTRESLEALPARWREKAQPFPMNGATPDELASKATPEAGGVFTVVTAGKLLPIKGFDLAIRSVVELGKRGVAARLLIAGEGPERKNLEALVRDCGGSTEVSFLGWRSHAEVLSLISSAHAFLFCSLRDGGAAVVVEAMACGVPVVCLDVAGPGIHVTNECGIKVAANRPDQAVRDLAAGLERLAKSPDLRGQLGANSRRRVQEIYLWANLGNRLEKIYRGATNRGPSESLSATPSTLSRESFAFELTR